METLPQGGVKRPVKLVERLIPGRGFRIRLLGGVGADHGMAGILHTGVQARAHAGEDRRTERRRFCIFTCSGRVVIK